MTRDQAQQILRAYRPGTSDADDPAVAEALKLAQQDADLETWLQRQAVFHASVRIELRRVVPPSFLREQILAKSRKVIPLWKRPEILLAAACLALSLIVAALWMRQPAPEETFAGFRSRMVGFALRVYRMDIETTNPTAVRRFLQNNGAPADYALTPGLQQTPVKGGASLSWQGHPVSMVCFGRPEEKTVYMFVINSAAISYGEVPGAEPVFAEFPGITTASWTQNGRVYLLAAHTTPKGLEKFLGRFLGFVRVSGPRQIESHEILKRAES
jgi:hypothetical protein